MSILISSETFFFFQFPLAGRRGGVVSLSNQGAGGEDNRTGIINE